MKPEEFKALVESTIKESVKTAFKEQAPQDERTKFIGTCTAGGKSMEDCAKEWDAKQTPQPPVTPVTQEAEWDTAYVNNLPDSAFAAIEAGGTKDAEGKTVPRSLRHLEFKNAAGNSDQPHVANGLARLDQTNMSAELKASAKSHLCAAAKELNMASEVCGLKGNEALIEARKESFDLKAKVATVEKQLMEAKASRLALKESVGAIVGAAPLRYFNHGAVVTLNEIKKLLQSSE